MKEVDNMYKTTTDLMQAAHKLEDEATNVTNQAEHGNWWNRKVALLHIVNGSLESGAFTGEAYSELWEAKHSLSRGEKKAGKYFR
jgi:hypothetical protein